MAKPKSSMPAPAGSADIALIQFRSGDDGPVLDVRLERETVWLSQRQMAALFDKDSDTVGLHIRNLFKEQELDPAATTEDSSVVQEEGGRSVQRRVRLYNLDVIISVGYRVKSLRGTQFRIWATRTLKDHLVRGYTLNESRLQAQMERLESLKAAVQLVGRVATERSLTSGEAKGLLKVVGDFSLALDLLDQYDHGRLSLHGTTTGVGHFLTAQDARQAIANMATTLDPKTRGLFGREKDKGLDSALGAIHQTFDGRDLYPSVEEKAARLLYLIVKNHAFVDGNKRIGAFLFLWFLDAHGLLYRPGGGKRLADNALVALTLLIAESRPSEMDVLCTVVVNLINQENS
jgi:prophage maintenance system killer protein